MTSQISPQDLKARIRAGGELALLDLREEGAFSEAHLFHARSLPLSRLELRVGPLVPRRAVPVAVMDQRGEPDGLAARGAAVLAELGYGDVVQLEGGVEGWRAAGFELFSGVNVPSKAFGEFVEIEYETPRLPAPEVQALIESGANMVILDSRPYEEFHRMNIPGGIDTPGAELVYRVHDLAPDPETLVVVNCAGRTRSIIGAQSLVNAGIPNRVVALKDGTMGWHLAGQELERGQTRRAPAPSLDGLAKAQAAAARVAARFGVQRIGRAELAAWQAEQAERTLFLLDVRSPEEFAAGHMAGSRSAPGGQLVQATDEYVGVLGARLVLIDDTGVRATMTASWLIQLGWSDVAVLEGGLAGPLVQGADRAANPAVPGDPAAAIEPGELQALLKSSQVVLVLDLAPSPRYRRSHLPGAAWATRAALPELSAEFAHLDSLVLTADDEALARLAAKDLKALQPSLEVRILAGGTAAWQSAGLPLESGLSRALSPTDDVWYKPYENTAAIEQEMRNYLTWEVALVEQIERDGDAGFRRFD